MEVVLANNASSTLQAGIEPEDTVIQVRAGDGAKFPVLSAGQFFPLTIVSTDGNSEIVYVVERNWDTFIVLRGQEGTSARSFPSGSVVELRLTKGVLDQFALLGKQASFSQISASDGAQLGGWRFTLAGDGSLEMRWGESIPYFIMTPEGLPLFWKMPMSSGRIFDAFPPGTRMVFQQETAPIDWVKITGIHDFALRLVEGNVGVGGAHPFSVVFGLRYIGHENLPNVPLYGGTNWAGDHAHEYGYYRGPSGSGGNGGQVHASTLNTGWTSVAGGPRPRCHRLAWWPGLAVGFQTLLRGCDSGSETMTPHAVEGRICPFHRKDVSKVCHKCPLWVRVRGLHPQTGEMLDEWQCAFTWVPVLMIESARQTSQAGAAIESFRNEVVRATTETLRLLSVGLSRVGSDRMVQHNTVGDNDGLETGK